MDRELIHSGVLELACGDMVVKHQVNLSKGPVLGLGQAEPTPDVAQKIGAGIEKTGFSTPVPC